MGAHRRNQNCHVLFEERVSLKASHKKYECKKCSSKFLPESRARIWYCKACDPIRAGKLLDEWVDAVPRCEICSREAKIHVDHDHNTGFVRGFLCQTCNTALGLFGDSINVLKSALAYLEINRDFSPRILDLELDKPITYTVRGRKVQNPRKIEKVNSNND